MKNEELIPQNELDAIAQYDAGLKLIGKSLLQLAENLNVTRTALNNSGISIKELMNAESKLSETEKELIRLNNEHVKLEARKTEAIKKATAENTKLRREVQLQNREYAAGSNTIEGLRVKVIRLTDAWKNTERGTREYRKALRELSSAQRELAKEEAKGGIFGRNVGNYPKILSSLKGFVAGFMSIRTGFTALKNATKTIADFEQANANLATILGKNRTEITALTESAKGLGATTEWMASQVTQLQTELAKLGFDETEIQNMQKSVLQFATTMGADLAPAAALAGAALRAFNLDSTETERVAAVMAVGANKSALSFGYLETAMSTIAPVARTFGFGIEDTVALLGVLSDSGFDASSAATATRNILLNLADANGKLAKTLGQPVRNLDEMAAAFIKLRDKGVDLATTLELTDKRSVAAFNTFLQGAESLTTLRGELTDVNGELKRIQEERLDTVQGSVKLLNSAWESLMLSFSNSAGPIKSAVDALTAFINTINRAVNPEGARMADEQARYQNMVQGNLAMLRDAKNNWAALDYTEEQAMQKANEMLDRQIDDANRTRETLQKYVSGFTDAEIEDAKRLQKFQSSRVGILFMSEERKARAQAYLDGTKQLEKQTRLAEDIARAAQDARDAYNAVPSVMPSAGSDGVDTYTDGGGDNPSASRSQLSALNREREALENINSAINEQLILNEQMIMDSESQNTSIADRVAATERLYNLEKQALYELAGIQRENLIQRNMDENPGRSRIEAEESTANQLFLLDVLTNNKRVALDMQFNDDLRKLENRRVEESIRAAELQMQERQRVLDEQESYELAALSSEYSGILANQTEYEEKRLEVSRRFAELRLQTEIAALEVQIAEMQNQETLTEDEQRKIVDLQMKVNGLLVNLNKKKNDEQIEDNRTARDKTIELIRDIANASVDIFGAVADIIGIGAQRQIEALDMVSKSADKAAEEEQARIERLAEAGAISEEQKNARIALSEQQLAAQNEAIDLKKRQLQARQAQYDHALNLAQATTTGTLAILSAWKLGWPAGLIASATVAATVLPLIAQIAATRIPQYAHGTDDHPGGLAWVGDGGRAEAILFHDRIFKTPATPTLMDLPEGAQILPDWNDVIKNSLVSDIIRENPTTNYYDVSPTAYDDKNMRRGFDRQSAQMETLIREIRRNRQEDKITVFKNRKIRGIN